MAIDRQAFERWRRSPPAPVALPRLLVGLGLVFACWVAATALVLTAGGVLLGPSLGDDAGAFTDAVDFFLATPAGVLLTLLTFSGIWAGVALAMRFVHREPLAALFGVSRRLSRPGLAKGFLAALAVGLALEAAFYARHPVLALGSIAPAAWLLVLAPAAALIFVQTAAEELLFRGYLLRGLAARFASPAVWALLPALAFTLLHWRGEGSEASNLAYLAAIGGFAALTVVLVWATGNLGAAAGVHWGNNAVAFLLVAHEEPLSGLALFHGAMLENIVWTPAETLWFILAAAIVGNGLTLLLLVHPRSPLKVAPDLGQA